MQQISGRVCALSLSFFHAHLWPLIQMLQQTLWLIRPGDALFPILSLPILGAVANCSLGAWLSDGDAPLISKFLFHAQRWSFDCYFRNFWFSAIIHQSIHSGSSFSYLEIQETKQQNQAVTIWIEVSFHSFSTTQQLWGSENQMTFIVLWL